MDKDYQRDYDEYIVVDQFSDDETKSLPPRSAKHGLKPKKKNGNILQMLTGSLIFIIIIAISVYFFMGLSDDEAEKFDAIPNTAVTTGENDSNNQPINNNGSMVTASEENETTEQNSDQDNDANMETTENSGEETIHVVKSGENLFRIAILYYNSGEYYEELAQYNGLNSASDIYAGMELKIPSKEKLTGQ